jgi:hypothetical protein
MLVGQEGISSRPEKMRMGESPSALRRLLLDFLHRFSVLGRVALDQVSELLEPEVVRPREATEAVAEFMEGKTTVMDFANRMERIRTLSAQKAAEQPKIESGTLNGQFPEPKGMSGFPLGHGRWLSKSGQNPTYGQLSA